MSTAPVPRFLHSHAGTRSAECPQHCLREGAVAASEGYRLEELLDIPMLQELFDGLNDAYPFPSAIVDIEGNILTATAWQEVCTRYHRLDEVSEL
jgi:hypothetical protein